MTDLTCEDFVKLGVDFAEPNGQSNLFGACLKLHRSKGSSHLNE